MKMEKFKIGEILIECNDKAGCVVFRFKSQITQQIESNPGSKQRIQKVLDELNEVIADIMDAEEEENEEH